MKHLKPTTNYWFTIEPYVYVGLTNTHAILYNTLDGVSIKSDMVNILNLLRELLQKENCGVVLLTNEQFRQKDINSFIRNLRKKYMGDVIDITLSNGKPVQLFPYFNYLDKHEKHDTFFSFKNILNSLFEISIHVDNTTNQTKLIPILQSISGISRFNLIGNMKDIANCNELLSFFDQHPSAKYLFCSYINVIPLRQDFKNNFSHKISVHFPVDIKRWNISRQILLNQTLPFEYIFEISSEEDCQQAEQLVKQYQIQQYQLKPIFNGDNIRFFEENVFLSKEDILSASISIKDIFTRQSINKHDFGKINIMPDGNVYANINHLALGNIYMHSIYEIVYKEMKEGTSWLRIRNQSPCSNCIYQWLCPPPSDYEIAIGRPNLCHVKQ